MQSSENRIGFSTGAIAKGDFRAALEVLSRLNISVVEISALRRPELPILLAAFADLDLSRFSYVSVHAPSRIEPGDEADVVAELAALPSRCAWIVVHPDTIMNCKTWRPIARRLAMENMDTRKPTGRTMVELEDIFEKLPEAHMCLDLAHAEKVDSTMFEAQAMIRRFGERIVQVHLSEIATGSAHHRLSIQGLRAARRVAKLIPSHVPVILESPVDSTAANDEIERARELFRPASSDLKKDIDAVLSAPSTVRRSSVAAFLDLLRRAGIEPGDAHSAIAQLPHGGPVARGQVFVTARDLYFSLEESEKKEIDDYYRRRISNLLEEFPELVPARRH